MQACNHVSYTKYFISRNYSISLVQSVRNVAGINVIFRCKATCYGNLNLVLVFSINPNVYSYILCSFKCRINIEELNCFCNDAKVFIVSFSGVSISLTHVTFATIWPR